ncbi:hypothetical protein QTP88_020458 [Uroleucon formosanum]
METKKLEDLIHKRKKEELNQPQNNHKRPAALLEARPKMAKSSLTEKTSECSDGKTREINPNLTVIDGGGDSHIGSPNPNLVELSMPSGDKKFFHPDSRRRKKASGHSGHFKRSADSQGSAGDGKLRGCHIVYAENMVAAPRQISFVPNPTKNHQNSRTGSPVTIGAHTSRCFSRATLNNDESDSSGSGDSSNTFCQGAYLEYSNQDSTEISHHIVYVHELLDEPLP